MLTLGMLLSLPSPVPRLNQKMFKPEYFDHLEKTRQASDAVADVKDWIGLHGGNWSSDNIRMWLPSILKQPNVDGSSEGHVAHHPQLTHSSQNTSRTFLPTISSRLCPGLEIANRQPHYWRVTTTIPLKVCRQIRSQKLAKVALRGGMEQHGPRIRSIFGWRRTILANFEA